MSELDQGPPESMNLPEEQGFVHIEEQDDNPVLATSPQPAFATSTPVVMPPTPLVPRSLERAGTLEHLAARRPVPALDENSPEIKQRLGELRTELTTLLTDFRWGGQSVGTTAERLTPLLNLGPIPQWRPLLLPFLLEIDRAGNLVPVWIKIIDQEDPQDLPATADPAETMVGRAKRYGILMLGNYKYANVDRQGDEHYASLPKFLGQLATNPTTSLYATQALAKQGTTAALQALIEALKDAEGWAKVDIIEACLSLNLTRFYDVLLASGLDRVSGLESYIAIPLYRNIPLENFLQQDGRSIPRLSQQAARIFTQVLQDSMTPPAMGSEALPVVFERSLLPQANALFEGARRVPTWQHTIALHRLAAFLGRYWSDISRGAIQDPRILEQVYPCFPLMPEVERWIDGPGRDVLLKTLNDSEEEAFTPTIKVLGELRDPRAITPLLNRLETVKYLNGREQALYVGSICDTLGRLDDRRAIVPMLQLLQRTVSTTRRTALDKRRENLPTGDPAIPESIVYAAVVRACGQLGDTSTLDTVLSALRDYDPYVRTQAIEALKHIEQARENIQSRIAIREALSDPRDAVVRGACQLVIQYHDVEAIPTLRRIIETRPDLAPTAYDALRQLGQ